MECVLKDVSIIIVNYNTCQLLINCISSIYRYSYGVSFEIIVVDNASVDDSFVQINSQFPDVVWIDADMNLGFGRANNLGAKYATGKYLFLLNSDTLLLNNAIKFFYDYAESHIDEQLGVLGCWLRDCEGRPNNSLGKFPTPSSEVRYLLGKFGINKTAQYGGDVDVDYVIGADMFIRRAIFEQFDGFDPYFFMYYEETDLQYRMARKGYVRRVIDTPQIVHLEGGSFSDKGLTFKRFKMAQRSYNYYIRKHFSHFRYIGYKCSLAFIRLTLFFTTDWTIKEKIKAYSIVLAK